MNHLQLAIFSAGFFTFSLVATPVAEAAGLDRKKLEVVSKGDIQAFSTTISTKENVHIYTAPDCVPCTQLKKYLNDNNLVAHEIDVTKQPLTAEQSKAIASNRVPVLVSAEERLEGFDADLTRQFYSNVIMRNFNKITAQAPQKKPDSDEIDDRYEPELPEILEPRTPPLNAVDPETTRVFYGYYKETVDTITQDPTTGTMIMTIPKEGGKFTAYYQFSYEGCDGEIDIGKVNGRVDSGSVVGDWTGDVDKVQIGGKFYGKFIENSSSIRGTYNLANRLDKHIEYDDECDYTVSAKGDWRVSEDGIKKDYIEIIKQGAAYRLKWSGFSRAQSLWVYDDECIRKGHIISDCIMWGREDSPSTLFEYGLRGINNFKPLEIGKTYIVVAYSMTNAETGTQFLSRSFVHESKEHYVPELDQD